MSYKANAGKYNVPREWHMANKLEALHTAVGM